MVLTELKKSRQQAERQVAAAPAPVEENLNLYTVECKYIRVTVVGTKPLLTNNPAAMGKTTKISKGERISDPEAEAESAVYRLEDGTCGVKGEAFRSAILGVAGSYKVKSKVTMKSLCSHIVVSEDMVPLRRRDGTPIKDYTIDSRRVIIGKAGIIRHRPKFEDWTAKFTIEYDPAILGAMPLECLKAMITDAGNRMGVGDYRPHKSNGPFGRFALQSFVFVD